MCGVFGSVGQFLDPITANVVLSSLFHRGPDNGMSIDLTPFYTVGMTRLIIRGDPSLEVPFIIDNHTVAFNGEIYGLLDKDYNLTEDIPLGGDKEIEFFLKNYNNYMVDGMFSIIVYDANSKSLSIFRDTVGIKPLFKRLTQNNHMVFASEIKALLVSESNKLDIDYNNIYDNFILGFSVLNSTPFVGIDEFTPGSHLLISKEKENLLSYSRYDKFPKPLKKISCEKNVIRDHIRKSLERCILSDYPIGLAVSGGLDSTILAYELNEMGVTNVKTFSVLTADTRDGLEDLNILDKCVTQSTSYKTWEHHTTSFLPEHFMAYLGKSVDIFTQPTRMTSFPLYVKLAELVSANNIKVLLTGEGVDEVFAGYTDYIVWLKNNEQKSFVTKHDVWRFFVSDADEEFYRGKFGQKVVEDCRERFYTYCLLDFDFSRPLQSLLKIEKTYRLRQLLLRSDLCLMSESIEGRVPFLHGGLKEKIATISDIELVSSAKISKHILRDAYADLIPSREIPKVRFRIPIDIWFKNELKSDITQFITDYFQSSSSKLGYVGANTIDEIDVLLENNANFVYRLLTYMMWEKKFKEHLN